MISILSTSYMRIKHLLFVVSFLFSLPVLSQETDSISHTYPILGYYRLGMTGEEFLSQMYKMQSETGLQDSISFQTQYLIDVNGINFDMDGGPASSCLDISATTCSLYKPDATPLYFAGGNLFPRWEIGFFYRQCLIINRLGCRALLHAGRISLARKPISHKSHVRHS